jgi:hypothetical protein
MGTSWANGYSAHVELYLLVGGEQLRVAQVGPDSLILRDIRVIAPSTSAKLVINIDDHHEEHEVVLFEGASGTRQPVKFF